MSIFTLELIFSFILILICVLIFLVDNPVHAVLFLILGFFDAAIILFLCDVQFLSIIFIIIYVGAIAILFLFVVMLLDMKRTDITSISVSFFSFIIIFIAVVFISSYISNIFFFSSKVLNFFSLSFGLYDNFHDITIIGQSLYNYYTSYFLLAGLVLLIALIGAIGLTIKFNIKLDSQLLYRQLSRTNHSITLFK